MKMRQEPSRIEASVSTKMSTACTAHTKRAAGLTTSIGQCAVAHTRNKSTVKLHAQSNDIDTILTDEATSSSTNISRNRTNQKKQSDKRNSF